jgi:hypothetical protein
LQTSLVVVVQSQEHVRLHLSPYLTDHFDRYLERSSLVMVVLIFVGEEGHDNPEYILSALEAFQALLDARFESLGFWGLIA